MQTLFLDSVASTQTYLKELVKSESIELPYAVVANCQTNGQGSRDNSWDSLDGNLFLSFALRLDELPVDLKLESSSIYFAYVLKNLLEELGSQVWLKWPNDFYIKDKKVGGVITNVVKDAIICGIGLNMQKAPVGFATLDLNIDKDKLLELYFKNIEKKVLWKQIFSKYKLNFYTNQKFFTHINNVKVSLSEAVLQSDGSLNVNGKRIYSLR